MTEREIEVASNLELQRRYESLAKQILHRTEELPEVENEMFLIDKERDRRRNPMPGDDYYVLHDDCPQLDDPWWANP